MGQTLEQQKMIHGFKFGQESVANWGNAGNWDNSGPNVRSKISHGIGGTNNQLDMSINSDNLSDGSIQSNISGTNIPANTLDFYEVDSFKIEWNGRTTSVQCCTGIDNNGFVQARVPGKHLLHLRKIG